LFIQEEIKVLLSETVQRSSSPHGDPLSKGTSARRRKQLASFMGSLLEEMAKAESSTKEGQPLGARSPGSSAALGMNQNERVFLIKIFIVLAKYCKLFILYLLFEIRSMSIDKIF